MNQNFRVMKKKKNTPKQEKAQETGIDLEATKKRENFAKVIRFKVQGY